MCSFRVAWLWAYVDERCANLDVSFKWNRGGGVFGYEVKVDVAFLLCVVLSRSFEVLERRYTWILEWTFQYRRHIVTVIRLIGIEEAALTFFKTFFGDIHSNFLCFFVCNYYYCIPTWLVFHAVCFMSSYHVFWGSGRSVVYDLQTKNG